MSRYCQVTGARPVTGHSISHSHRRSKRRWLPNGSGLHKIFEYFVWITVCNM